ncbi:MAG: NAD(P)/FAD-dependent oxidoreductase [Thermodesulfobacteriota bacterium]|nr:NAD(P)/FAD-dependent oxidoreductase [Thermodesulfobacteriota bacterium]
MENSIVNSAYDAIIVGAGPSGAATAKALTDEGLTALILERKELPRHKCCSGVLFGESQVLLKEYFGTLPPEEVYCEPRVINADNIHRYEGKGRFSPWLWEWPKGGRAFPRDYLNVWRHKFDFWLAKKSRGQIIDRCIFEGFSTEGDLVKVKARQRGKPVEYHGKYLVGADGGASSVRHALDPTFKKKYIETSVYQAYYRYKSMSLEHNHWYIFFGEGFGFGCLHIKDGLLTMCVGPPWGIKVKPAFENFRSFLKKRFHVNIGDFVRHEGCRLNNMFVAGNFHQGKNRVLLVGEAAGLIHMNASGIDTSLDSGYRAGASIAKALKKGVDGWKLYYEMTEDIREHIRECAKHQEIFRLRTT